MSDNWNFRVFVVEGEPRPFARPTSESLMESIQKIASELSKERENGVKGLRVWRETEKNGVDRS